MALTAWRQNQVAEDEPVASRFLVLREDSFRIGRIGRIRTTEISILLKSRPASSHICLRVANSFLSRAD